MSLDKLEVYCAGCGKRIIVVPFFGEKSYKFQDGVYCEACARLVVEKRRKKLNG